MSEIKRMMTLGQFSRRPSSIPTTVVWTLAGLTEARGKQELFTRQSPQKLKVLREHALIESAVSSNRIEGVTVAHTRIRTLIFGEPVPRDRNEEEVRGYRAARSGTPVSTRRRTWTSSKRTRGAGHACVSRAPQPARRRRRWPD